VQRNICYHILPNPNREYNSACYRTRFMSLHHRLLHFFGSLRRGVRLFSECKSNYQGTTNRLVLLHSFQTQQERRNSPELETCRFRKFNFASNALLLTTIIFCLYIPLVPISIFYAKVDPYHFIIQIMIKEDIAFFKIRGVYSAAQIVRAIALF